jgi:hypothetical protein
VENENTCRTLRQVFQVSRTRGSLRRLPVRIKVSSQKTAEVLSMSYNSITKTNVNANITPAWNTALRLYDDMGFCVLPANPATKFPPFDEWKHWQLKRPGKERCSSGRRRAFRI